MLTAPPCILTFPGSSPHFLIFARATTLNASFTSNIATSSWLTPACFKHLGIARAGAIVKSMGAQAASAKPVIMDHFKQRIIHFIIKIIAEIAHADTIFLFNRIFLLTDNSGQRLHTTFPRNFIRS